jgi:hypothetical protein
VLFKQGKNEETAKHLQAALSLWPDYPQAKALLEALSRTPQK